MECPSNTKIYEHVIKLVKENQLPYKSIYNLFLIELKTLKTYIKTYLKTEFIQLSKSSIIACILFNKKVNKSFCLDINYWGFNILTIKNRYPLSLIEEFLNRLERAKQFAQLDLTNAYYRMRINKDGKWKTVFHIRYSYFEYQVIPFNLSNILASFQGFINKILAKKLDIFVIIYSNKILIYIEDLSQLHIDIVC